MKLINRETKEEVDVIKNEDGTYTADGVIVKKEDMARLFMKPKEETPKSEVGTIVTESKAEHSDELGALALALAKCQGEFEAVKKNSQASKYNYADLEAVLASSRLITSKYELAISQMNVSKTVGDNLLVGVKTMLLHSSGQWISSEIYVPAVATKMNTLVQMAGVNITYLRRYGLQSILGLVTTDTDGV
jgi:hypothetical protein